MQKSDSVPALKPAHPDLKSCEAWLAAAPMGDPRQACAAWLTLIEELTDVPPPRHTWQQILETLLPRVLAAISEQTRRFAARPLPLSAFDELAFGQVSDLWQALLRSYRSLLRAAVEAGDSRDALILPASRSTTFASELIAACLLARREVSTDLWQWLHVNYAFAEARGIADIPVGNNAGGSCAAAYVHALLFALARPHSLSQRDALWARTWARRFSHRVRIISGQDTITPREARLTHAYAVNLGSDAGPFWRPAHDLPGEPGATHSPLRFLDTQPLAHSLRKRLRLLEAGEDPAALGLGKGCSQPGAGALLRQLLRAWCAAPPVPQFPRRGVDVHHAIATVAVGVSAAHRATGGRIPASATRQWSYSRREFEHLYTFQHATAPAQERAPLVQPPEIERWQVLDQSAFGFRLRTSGATRIAHRQLLALQAGGSNRFLLAEVRWLTQSAKDGVSLGVQVFPGLPCACTARVSSADPTRREDGSVAFVLPSAHGALPSLILPAGAYQRDKRMELQMDEGVVGVRLAGLLDRGFDFDRVSYTPAD